MNIADQIAALRETTATVDEFVARLAGLYRDQPVEVARILDEHIDRSGRLLGLVRQAARDERP